MFFYCYVLFDYVYVLYFHEIVKLFLLLLKKYFTAKHIWNRYRPILTLIHALIKITFLQKEKYKQTMIYLPISIISLWSQVLQIRESYLYFKKCKALCCYIIVAKELDFYIVSGASIRNKWYQRNIQLGFNSYCAHIVLNIKKSRV